RSTRGKGGIVGWNVELRCRLIVKGGPASFSRRSTANDRPCDSADCDSRLRSDRDRLPGDGDRDGAECGVRCLPMSRKETRQALFPCMRRTATRCPHVQRIVDSVCCNQSRFADWECWEWECYGHDARCGRAA